MPNKYRSAKLRVPYLIKLRSPKGVFLPDRSEIEWTDATWNPTTGCTKVSSGCDNCYAEALAHRLLSRTYGKALPVIDTPSNRSDPFAVRIWPDRLNIPKKWKASRRIFVNSMSDLFHADIPDLFIRQIFEVMLDANHHTYQILTKRPSRARRFLHQHRDLVGSTLPSHIWLGTSVEDSSVAYRLRQLVSIPAAVRFLSCEPLLGPISIASALPDFPDALHWVIAGGESGSGARPVKVEWLRSLRDECVVLQIPFFFKQWGGRTPKVGGRELDGRYWEEYPTGSLAVG